MVTWLLYSSHQNIHNSYQINWWQLTTIIIITTRLSEELLQITPNHQVILIAVAATHNYRIISAVAARLISHGYQNISRSYLINYSDKNNYLCDQN
jgi:hypothetical protein